MKSGCWDRSYPRDTAKAMSWVCGLQAVPKGPWFRFYLSRHVPCAALHFGVDDSDCVGDALLVCF
jgi:hypothetical protein